MRFLTYRENQSTVGAIADSGNSCNYDDSHYDKD